MVALAASFQVAARTLDEIRERGRLTYCAFPNALPFASEKGNPIGLHVEFAREIAKALGVELRMVWMQPRHRRMVGECDLGFDEIQGQEARDFGVVASQPYLRTGVALAVHPEVKVKGFADLTPTLRIGVPLGSDSEAYLRGKGLQPKTFAMTQEMQEAFDAGALDVILMPAQSTAYALHVNPNPAWQLIHAYRDEPALSWNVVITLRHGDQALVDAVNAAVRNLRDSGQLAAMYAAYGIPYLAPN